MEVIIDGIKYAPVADNITIYWMHDGQEFSRIKDTSSINRIIEQSDEFWREDPYGCLCPISVRCGDKEIRRVGVTAHGRPDYEEWCDQKAKWWKVVNNDHEVMAIINSTPAG